MSHSRGILCLMTFPMPAYLFPFLQDMDMFSCAMLIAKKPRKSLRCTPHGFIQEVYFLVIHLHLNCGCERWKIRGCAERLKIGTGLAL